MLRRPNFARPLVMAAVVCAALAARCPAAGIASPKTYQLTNNSGVVVDHVFIGFIPIGVIVEPGDGTSPLFLRSAPTFDGIEPDFGIFNFKKTPDSPAEQALGLDFLGTGFGFLQGRLPTVNAPGGLEIGESVTFKLNLDETLADQLLLTLLDPPPGSGLVLTELTDPPIDPTPPPVTPPTPQFEIPEPLSLAVWSALASVGLLRARVFRRSRA